MYFKTTRQLEKRTERHLATTASLQHKRWGGGHILEREKNFYLIVSYLLPLASHRQVNVCKFVEELRLAEVIIDLHEELSLPRIECSFIFFIEFLLAKIESNASINRVTTPTTTPTTIETVCRSIINSTTY